MTRLDATFAALVLIQVVHSVEHLANPRNCHPAGPPEAQDPQGLEGMALGTSLQMESKPA